MVGGTQIRPIEWPRRGQRVVRLVAFCRSRPLAGTFGGAYLRTIYLDSQKRGAYAIRPYPGTQKRITFQTSI